MYRSVQDFHQMWMLQLKAIVGACSSEHIWFTSNGVNFNIDFAVSQSSLLVTNHSFIATGKELIVDSGDEGAEAAIVTSIILAVRSQFLHCCVYDTRLLI